MKGRFPVYYVALLIFCLANGALKANSQTVTLQGKDFLSPEIVIVSPAEKVVDRDVVLLKGAVLSYKLPITEIVFSLNGVIIGRRKPVSQTRYEFEIPFTLKLGNNQITVMAANSKASSQHHKSISYETSQTLAQPKLAVLAVGISNYEHSRSRFGESDAREFADKINQQKGCLFQTIDSQVLLGKEANREGILKALNWLNDAAPSNSDVRMLYISGNTAKDSYGNPYLLSQDHEDATDLELSDIKLDLLFNKLAAVRNPALLFLDASSSDPSYGRASGPQQLGLSQKGRSFGADNVTAFISSMGKAVPLEIAPLRNRAFTLALLEGISGKADSSQDKYVDVDELQKWLTKRVLDLTNGKQQPFYLGEPKPKPQRMFCNDRP